MVDFKVFTAAVIVVTAFLVVALSSLAANEEADQYSDAAVQYSAAVVGNEQMVAVVDDARDIPEAVDLSGEHLPLMVRWSNWLPEFGPAYVYARERDLSGMLDLDAPVEKMLMVASYDEVQRLVGQTDQLKAAGVTIIGFNSENGSGMTPANEMQTLDSADPDVNVVARAANLARENGFKVMWGPVRMTVDSLSDAAIRTMIRAGVTGLAIQEQKFIENQSAAVRLSAVQQTRERYLRLAQQEGVEDFTFHVQIMQQRCPDLPNCVTFVAGLEAIPVDSIAIWSNGPIPVEFVNAIRME